MSQIRNKFSWKLKQPRNKWYIFGFISFLICYERSCRSSGLLIPAVAHTLHWPKGVQTPALVQGLQNCCIISPVWNWSSTSGSHLQKRGQLFPGVTQVLALKPGFWTSQVWCVARSTSALLRLLRYRRLCEGTDPASSCCWYQFLFVFAVREGIKWVVGTYLCKSRNKEVFQLALWHSHGWSGRTRWVTGATWGFPQHSWVCSVSRGCHGHVWERTVDCAAPTASFKSPLVIMKSSTYPDFKTF